MTTVHYVCPDGSERDVQARNGWSVMETATKQGIPGMIAECGGAAACGTCHVYVAPEFLSITGEADDMEGEMLDDALAERRPNSRLACQIKIDDSLEGLVVEIAAEQ